MARTSARSSRCPPGLRLFLAGLVACIGSLGTVVLARSAAADEWTAGVAVSWSQGIQSAPGAGARPVSTAPAPATLPPSAGGDARRIEPAGTPLPIDRDIVQARATAGSRPHTFVVLGDSLSAWAFLPGSAVPSTDGSWPSLLADQEPGLVLVKNAGVPGDTTGQMLARMQRDVLTYSPDMLFVLGGTNDIGLGLPEPTILATIRLIVETAKAHGIAVVVLTVPPANGQFASRRQARLALNADLASLARDEGIRVVDTYAALATTDGDLAPDCGAPDGLHLTQTGEQQVADAVERLLHPPSPPRSD